MDINKVVFGDYSLGAKSNNAQKLEEQQEAPKASVESETKSVDAEAVFNAMNIAAMQNKAQITQVEKKEVNPADHLAENRIADIEEAMMGKFEDGVNTVANVIREEFPWLAEDAILALAAKIFAQE